MSITYDLQIYIKSIYIKKKKKKNGKTVVAFSRKNWNTPCIPELIIQCNETPAVSKLAYPCQS